MRPTRGHGGYHGSHLQEQCVVGAHKDRSIIVGIRNIYVHLHGSRPLSYGMIRSQDLQRIGSHALSIQFTGDCDPTSYRINTELLIRVPPGDPVTDLAVFALILICGDDLDK